MQANPFSDFDFAIKSSTEPKINMLPPTGKFAPGKNLNGYIQYTQISTGYKKWVSVREVMQSGIEIAFYDASWNFNPRE